MEKNIHDIITKVLREIDQSKSEEILTHRSARNMPMPSIGSLDYLMTCLKKVLFPGFYGNSEVSPDSMDFYVAANLDMAYRALYEQIKRGYCFACSDSSMSCSDCEENAKAVATKFIESIPQIKHLLATDVVAAYNGDPAAKSYGETIFCYPSIMTLTHYRIANVLFRLNVPIIPRIITEMAHSLTGIDIHPGASIGEYFFIDHGTGVVIGETTIIGKNVRLYQGVTLGAKSFPLDENGKPIKGIPRHPIVEDDVIIYSNSTILGRITIGKGATVGGNMWVTENVAPGAKVAQHR